MSALGRYVLRERIGVGGMGEVFLAATKGAAGFEKKVVIKRLLPTHASDEAARTLFLGEALLLTKLDHPSIVSVIDFGVGERDDYFVVLEHVDGVDLEKLIRSVEKRGERLAEPIALRIAAQVLRGLAFAHELAAREQKTLVHRDVSPGNVLLSKAGEVKLADFGVTLVSDAGVGSDGAHAGKPPYMSPEQIARAALDPRSDLFSVGVLLHRMLAGALPFSGTDRAEPPSPLTASPDTCAIVERALALDPAKRWARAREMLGAIEALPLASSDELGELVTRALAEAPSAGEAVVVLKAPKGEDLRGTELTLRRDEPAPTVAPRRRLWPILVPVPFALAAALWIALPSQGATSTAAASATAATSIAAPQPSASAPPSATAVKASSAPSTSASAPRLGSALPAAPLASPASIPPDCQGTVWLRADNAWRVTDGALTAEAPDRVTWPCGVHDVVATSKLDPKQTKRVRITVSPMATATIDLR